MKKFTEYLDEGLHDPASFKAIFLAGGPGSGKSYVIDNLALKALGFGVVDADSAFVHGLKKAGMPVTPDVIGSEEGQNLRRRMMDTVIAGRNIKASKRLGLVFDGTGRDYNKIKEQKEWLESLGYDTMMVFVNTDLDTALERNRQRSRTLPDKIVYDLWKAAQNNLGRFQNLFDRNMLIVDNSEGHINSHSLTGTYKRIAKWAKEPPSSPAAKRWHATTK